MSLIKIEVAYATPEKQLILEVDVESGTSVRAAAESSGMDKHFDGLDLSTADLGIFGKSVRKPDQESVRAGDRVEIYRPLMIDPKQARLNRAAKK